MITVLFRDSRGDYPGHDGGRHPLLTVRDIDGGVLHIEMSWADPSAGNNVVAYGTSARDMAQVEALRDALTKWLKEYAGL